jgi:hypothetical protein
MAKRFRGQHSGYARLQPTTPAGVPCDGCEYLKNGKYCMLSANHCSRRAEDFFTRQA